MDKEEYYKRIERINNKFKTDRVSADEEYQLVCQKNYLSTKYIEHLEQQCKRQKEVIDKIESLIKSKDNGTCIHNNERRGAYTFILDFDEAREFIWKLEDILKEVSE